MQRARTASVQTSRLGTSPLYTRPPQLTPSPIGLTTFHQTAQLTINTHCSAVNCVRHHERNIRWSAPEWSKAVRLAALEARLAPAPKALASAQWPDLSPWVCRDAQSRQARPEKVQEPSMGGAKPAL